jgi:hypothetical protein
MLASDPSGSIVGNKFQNLSIGIKIEAKMRPSLAGNSFTGNVTNISNLSGYFLVGETTSQAVPAGSRVSLTSSVVSDIASVTLTPGTWSCTGLAGFSPAGTTTIANVAAGITAIPHNLPAPGAGGRVFLDPAYGFATGGSVEVTTGAAIFSITIGTAVYLVGSSDFAKSTMGAYGNLDCVRVN